MLKVYDQIADVDTNAPYRLSITQDWFVEDVKTISDCDRAMEILTEDLNIISVQLQTRTNVDREPSPEGFESWMRRVKVAQTMKQGALDILTIRRRRLHAEAYLNREKAILRLIKAMDPELFNEAQNKVEAVL